MFGAIIGDIIGSTREFRNTKDYDFELFPKHSDFTDDSVLTCAVANAILTGDSYKDSIVDFANRYPGRGYGGGFKKWLNSMDTNKPYNSFGNGSAMRVSPIGFAFDTLEKTLEEAKKSAEVSHNHPEGIKGAQAVASAVFLARTGESQSYIKMYIIRHFGYNLERNLDDIRPNYKFYETCQDSVPEAIIAFLESENYEDAIRKAISLGGDSDTIGCIAGGIAQAYFGKIPLEILKDGYRRLPMELCLIIQQFNKKFKIEE